MRACNVLWITSDQHHWTALGRHNPAIHTPNLDRLAARGMLLERAYCTNPTCTPSRASLITGQLPSQHRAYSLGTKLNESITTVGDCFQQAGYQTGLIGKAHFQQMVDSVEFPSIESFPTVRNLDMWRDFHGPYYGFSRAEITRPHADEASVGQHYAIWMEEKGLHNWRDYFRNTWRDFHFNGEAVDLERRHVWDLPEQMHSNRWIEERSIHFMEQSRQKGQPFFCWASYFDPHPPYLVPEPWASMYDPATIEVPELVEGEHHNNPPHFGKTQEKCPDFSVWQDDPYGNAIHGCHSHLEDSELRRKNIAVYYGMVSFMDHSIGKLLDYLDEAGLADSTLVAFTSDHGHFFGQHGLKAKGPFHYEDLLKVPTIVSWPGMIAEGSHSDALVSLHDLPVTSLRAADLPVPLSMTGIDQLPVLCGEARSVRSHVIVENRHQPFRLYLKTYINQCYKLTIYRDAAYGELFDLKSDPDELNNLWDDITHATLKAQLTAELLYATMADEVIEMPRIGNA